MEETIELTIAGQMVSSPLGATISLPYLPWSPGDVAAMGEDDRESCLKIVRAQREAIINALKK